MVIIFIAQTALKSVVNNFFLVVCIATVTNFAWIIKLLYMAYCNLRIRRVVKIDIALKLYMNVTLTPFFNYNFAMKAISDRNYIKREREKNEETKKGEKNPSLFYSQIQKFAQQNEASKTFKA